MYLSAYHFAGDPTDLIRRHDQGFGAVPAEALLLHVVVVTDRGITVYDACPSREVADAFHHSPELANLLRTSGLPDPLIESIGEIASTVTSPMVAR